MSLQSDDNISPLAEELDFEEEADASNDEEFNITKGSKDDGPAFEGIEQSESKLENIKDLSDLEDGEVSDDSVSKKETNISSNSELNAEKTKEDLNDLEEGEISESDSTNKSEKVVCRYFKYGNCIFGSHCHFLHISDNVYNMFNSTTYKRNVVKAPVPCPILPEIESLVHPVQNDKTAWEKGLENARATIQKAASRRIDDKEFENKRLYLSSNSVKSNVPQDPSFETNSKSVLNESPSFEPFRENKFVPNKTMKQSSYSDSFRDKKPTNSHEYKWVDPWQRSKSRDKKRRRSRSSSRRSERGFSSSSSSSIERIYRGSDGGKKPYKKSSTSQRKKSYSRSVSKSPSWSRSRKRRRSRSLSWSRSPSKKTRRKRSTSLEKWYKEQHRNGSRSSSRSSVLSARRASRSVSPKCNSDNESWNSVTVSSISCSHTSSDSSESHSRESKSSVKNKPSNSKSTAISQNATKPQRSKPPLSDDCIKDRSASNHSITVPKEEKSVGVSYQNTTEKSNTCTIGNISDATKPQKTTPKPVSVSSSKSPQSKAISKVSRCPSIADDSCHGAYSEPISPVTNSVPSSKALDNTNTLKESDNKKAFSLPKKTIALNLQPKSPKQPKPPEVPCKKNSPATICKLLMEKSTLSRKEHLLKQLKLIEDAISKKKKC